MTADMDSGRNDEQRRAAAAHMKATRGIQMSEVPKKTAEEIEVETAEDSEASEHYAASADLAKALLNNEQEGEDGERDSMLRCIGGLLEGGVMLMTKLEKAKKVGGSAIVFGHLKQGVSVGSLKELTAKTGQTSGPLYEQVMRIFSTCKDVTRVEIWPSHIHGQR